MNRKVYKLKYFTDEVEGENQYKDVWIDVNSITGFMIPFIDEDSEQECSETVNIFLNDGKMTLKQEKKLIKYLTEEFVDKAK